MTGPDIMSIPKPLGGHPGETVRETSSLLSRKGGVLGIGGWRAGQADPNASVGLRAGGKVTFNGGEIPP